MKNLFGLFKNSEETTFSKFVIRKLSNENADKADALANEGNKLDKSKTAPQWLSFISIGAILLGLLFVLLIIADKDGFTNALQERGYLFYIGLGLVVVGVILQIIFRTKAKQFNVDPEVQEYITRVDEAVKECEFELNVPETAIKMDILFAILKKTQNGEEKVGALDLVQYVNQDLKVFVENDLLCFSDTYMVVGVPLNSIKGIKTINKRIGLPQWNKPEMFNSPKYKPYKLHVNGNNGLIFSKPYYEIDLTIEDEDYCLFLPSYEKEPFLKLFENEIPNLD